MKNIFNDLFFNKPLSKKEAKNILINFYENKFNKEELIVLSTIYNIRDITLNEIEGFREALLEKCLKVNINEFNAIDIVGTGGDGKNTFNISTITCFILAGTGEKVIKQGNYNFSSVSGSSNILKFLGYKFTTKESLLKKQLDKIGLCYLHAPLFHPLFKKYSFLRKKINMKTFFNVLGPLINPSIPKNNFIGVSNMKYARLYYYFFQKTNNNYNIIYSFDGYDEISLTNKFKCFSSSKGEKTYYPNDLTKYKISDKDLYGGINIKENVKIFLNILNGNGTKEQNVVVLTNAAFALGLLNNNDFKINYEIAKVSLKSGKAKNILRKLLEYQ